MRILNVILGECYLLLLPLMGFMFYYMRCWAFYFLMFLGYCGPFNNLVDRFPSVHILDLLIPPWKGMCNILNRVAPTCVGAFPVSMLKVSWCALFLCFSFCVLCVGGFVCSDV